MNTNTNRPPHKRQATVIDYDSDMADSPTITTAVAPISNNNNSIPSSNNSNLPNMATPIDYVTELLLLKSKIQALRTLLTATIEQIKNKIVAICTPRHLALWRPRSHIHRTPPSITMHHLPKYPH